MGAWNLAWYWSCHGTIQRHVEEGRTVEDNLFLTKSPGSPSTMYSFLFSHPGNFQQRNKHRSKEHCDRCFILLMTNLHIIIFSIFDCSDSSFYSYKVGTSNNFRIFKEGKLNIQQRFSVPLFHGCWNSITVIFKHCLVLFLYIYLHCAFSIWRFLY